MESKSISLERVTFEQAKALCELGFPQLEEDLWHCKYMENDTVKYDLVHYNYFTNIFDITGWKPDEKYCAPYLELVAKWLREEKNYDIHIGISWEDPDNNPHKRSYSLAVIYASKMKFSNISFPSYEKALSKGIDIVIESLK